MALLDLTTRRETLDIINQLPAGMRTPAWTAANPALAAEADLWASEPRRTARCSIETVTEAVTYISDNVTLEALEDSDRRLTVRNAAYERRRVLQRLAEVADTMAMPIVARQRDYGHLDEAATLDALASRNAEDAARLLYTDMYRLDGVALTAWLKSLTTEAFTELIAAKFANSQLLVLEEMLRRGFLDEAFGVKTSSNVLIDAMASHVIVDGDIARRIIKRSLVPTGWKQLTWTREGLGVLKDARQYDTLLGMRAIDVAEIVRDANGLTMQEIEELLRVNLTAFELELIESDVLCLARAGHRLSGAVINAYIGLPKASPELKHLLLLNCDTRAIVRELRTRSSDEQRRFVDEFSAFRPGELSALLVAVGQEPETTATQSLLWMLCEQITNPVPEVTGRVTWLTSAVLGKVVTELDETDWKTFFKLVHDFSGTLDELISTVQALR